MRVLKLVVALIVITFNLKAQQVVSQLPLIDQILKYQDHFPIEKVYLTIDKNYYNAGDTLWFKSILINRNQSINKLSDKVYVELYNDSAKFVERRVIVLNSGLGFGDFALKKSLPNGTYTLRAYSNWQQNFGEDYFYQKSFYIGNATASPWLLSTDQNLNTNGPKPVLDLKVRLTSLNNIPIGSKDVELSLLNDKKRLMKVDARTNADGILEIKLPLSEKIAGNYSFFIVDKNDKNKNATIPLLLENDKIDLQFMPEGGYMVSDIYGRVAFKALTGDGLGKDITGNIVNSKNEIVVPFSATHKGMGSFYLLPKKAETYTAVFSINGKEKRQNLPLVKDLGTTLRINHLSNPDSLSVYIKISEGIKTDQKYLLVAQTTEKIILNADLNLSKGFSTLKLAKNTFPDGIIHFTLFSPDRLPLNERQVLINKNRKINISIQPDQTTYRLKDSIALAITATAEDGSPLTGSFSIAVTDDQQIKQKENDQNILSYFLLQSDLKGNIEEPAWYFSNNEPNTLMALDHLLLTQAWVGYKWNNMLKQNLVPTFTVGNGTDIGGRLSNALNKPIPNLKVTLLSLSKKIFVADTLSNKDGNFLFKNLPLLDSADYVIKIKNSKGRSSPVKITINEFIPAPKITHVDQIFPWYWNVDQTLLTYFQTSESQKKEQQKAVDLKSGNTLKEILVEGKRDSREDDEIWGLGLAQTISEEELKKAPRKMLIDLLREKIAGFGVSRSYINCSTKPTYNDFDSFVINNQLVSLVRIDKISTNIILRTGPELFEENNRIFSSLNAEDIKSIKVYKGCSVFTLEITTRSGKGPWVSAAIGVYVYKPLPLYVGKEFYSPKYTVDKSSTKPDLRSTIYWNANIVTDEKGKAKVSFYAADKPSTYSISVEGTDLIDRFGYHKRSIVIAK